MIMDLKTLILLFIGITLGAGVLGFLLHEYIWGLVGLIGFIITALGVFGILRGEFFLLGIGLVVLASAFLSSMLCYSLWDLFPTWQPLLHR